MSRHFGEINLNVDLNIDDNASRHQQASQDKPDNERTIATGLSSLAEAAKKVNLKEQQTKFKVSVHVPPSFSWGSIAFGLLQLLENKEEEWKRENEVLERKLQEKDVVLNKLEDRIDNLATLLPQIIECRPPPRVYSLYLKELHVFPTR